MFYAAFGHYASAFQEPEVMDLFIAGIKLGRPPPLAAIQLATMRGLISANFGSERRFGALDLRASFEPRFMGGNPA